MKHFLLLHLFLLPSTLAAESSQPPSALAAVSSSRPPAGVNFADALWRVLDDPVNGLPSTRAAARAACTDYGLSSVRFGASPFWPDTFVSSWAAGAANRTAYWATVDGVMQAFVDGGCAHLVPSLLFNTFMIVDAAKEPLGQLAAGARAQAQAQAQGLPTTTTTTTTTTTLSWTWAVEYVTEFVARYGPWNASDVAGGGPLVVAWEITNEFNLLVDLNQTDFCNECNPPRGTPSSRTLADNVSTDDWVAISAGLADAIRAADPLPGRPVSGGTALARTSAQHLRASYTLPDRDWTNDTFAEFVDNFADIHACCEWASVHIYADDGGRWGGGQGGGAANASDLILFAQQAAAQVSAKRGSPLLLYLGEYGELPGPDGLAAPRPFVGAVLDVLASTAPGSPGGPPPPPGVAGQTALATIWVWEYPGQNVSYSLYPGLTEGVNGQLVAYNKGE
jgi:hypothetical protein